MRDVGQFVTAITLDHTFTTAIPNALKPNQPVQVPQLVQSQPTKSPAKPPSITTTNRMLPASQGPTQPANQKPTNISPSVVDSLENVNFQCGSPEFRQPTTTGLVIGGYQAVRGQFPW